jgi:hypothetical protein
MATADLLAEKQPPRAPQHFLLRGVDWETYCKLRDALRGRPAGMPPRETGLEG